MIGTMSASVVGFFNSDLNLDLADLFPPLLDVSHAPDAGQEIITQLRLLHSTVGVKLDQFDRAPYRGVLADRKFR